MKGEQKSAEGVVAIAHSGEGPNVEGREECRASMDEGDADRRAEMPEDSRKVAGGTRENMERERQTSKAVERTLNW